MVTVTLRCQHCQSTNLVRNGLAADGRQRYLCRDCQQRSRAQPRTNAYSDEEREQILRAYDERSSVRGLSRTGVLDLTDPTDQKAVLDATPVGDVWGVGPAYAKMLKGAGVDTARKLRDADRRWVRQRMTVVGARIVEELRGVSCIPLEKCPQGRKSLTCSRSFGVLVESLAELREAVAVYMTKAAERLRRSRLAAGVVTVFINTSRFGTDPQYSNSATFELAYSTDSTEGCYRGR